LTTYLRIPVEKKRWLFKPGQVASPHGRPNGSRIKLSEDFIRICMIFGSAKAKAVLSEWRINGLRSYRASVPRAAGSTRSGDARRFYEVLATDCLCRRVDQLKPIILTQLLGLHSKTVCAAVATGMRSADHEHQQATLGLDAPSVTAFRRRHVPTARSRMISKY
jgi:hypothetical protein